MTTYTPCRWVLCDKCGAYEWACVDWRKHIYECRRCGHRREIEP
jgi:hypothetical protein